MKKFWISLTVLSLCLSSALAAHASPGAISSPPNKQKGTSTPGGSKNKQGSGSKGQAKKHHSHSKTWKGWQKRQFSKRLGYWLYWSVDDGCWYRYDEETATFVPCENLTDENLND